MTPGWSANPKAFSYRASSRLPQPSVETPCRGRKPNKNQNPLHLIGIIGDSQVWRISGLFAKPEYDVKFNAMSGKHTEEMVTMLETSSDRPHAMWIHETTTSFIVVIGSVDIEDGYIERTIFNLCKIASMAKDIAPNITVYISTVLVRADHHNFLAAMAVNDELSTLFGRNDDSFVAYEMGGIILLDWAKVLLHEQALQLGGYVSPCEVFWENALHVNNVGARLFMQEFARVKLFCDKRCHPVDLKRLEGNEHSRLVAVTVLGSAGYFEATEGGSRWNQEYLCAEALRLNKNAYIYCSLLIKIVNSESYYRNRLSSVTSWANVSRVLGTTGKGSSAICLEPVGLPQVGPGMGTAVGVGDIKGNDKEDKDKESLALSQETIIKRSSPQDKAEEETASVTAVRSGSDWGEDDDEMEIDKSCKDKECRKREKKRAEHFVMPKITVTLDRIDAPGGGFDVLAAAGGLQGPGAIPKEYLGGYGRGKLINKITLKQYKQKGPRVGPYTRLGVGGESTVPPPPALQARFASTSSFTGFVAFNTHALPPDVNPDKYSVSMEDILKAAITLAFVENLPNWKNSNGSDADLEQWRSVEYHIQRVVKLVKLFGLKGSLELVLAAANKGVFDVYDE